MLVTIITIAQLVYVVGLAVWILFEKRSPLATIAWILALIALPYLGFVIFFILGPRRLVRKRLKHKRAGLSRRLSRSARATRHTRNAIRASSSSRFW